MERTDHKTQCVNPLSNSSDKVELVDVKPLTAIRKQYDEITAAFIEPLKTIVWPSLQNHEREEQEMSSSIKQLRSDIQQKEVELHQNKVMVEQLKNQLEEKERELDIFQEEVSLTLARLQVIHDTKEGVTKDIKYVESEIMNTEAKLDVEMALLKNIVTELEEQCQHYQTLNNERNEVINCHNQQLGQMGQILTSLTSQNVILDQKFTESRQKVSDMEKKYHELKILEDQLKENSSVLSTQLEDQNSVLQNLEFKFGDLKLKKNRLKENSCELQNKLHERETVILELTENVREMENKLGKILEEVEKNDREANGYICDIHAAQEKLKMTEKLMVEEREKIEKEISVNSEIRTQKEKTIHEWETTNRDLERRLEETVSELKSSEMQKKNLCETISLLEESNRRKLEEISALVNTEKSFRQTLNKSREDYEVLSRRCTDLQEKYSENSDKLSRLQVEQEREEKRHALKISDLEKNVSEKDAEMRNLKGDIEKLDIAFLSKTLEDRDHVAEGEKLSLELRKQQESLQTTEIALSTEMEVENSQIHQLQRSLSELSEISKAVDREVYEKKKSLQGIENENLILSSEISQVSEALVSAKKLCTEVQKSVEDQEEEIKRKETEMLEKLSRLNQQNASTKEKLEKQKSELEKEKGRRSLLEEQKEKIHESMELETQQFRKISEMGETVATQLESERQQRFEMELEVEEEKKTTLEQDRQMKLRLETLTSEFERKKKKKKKKKVLCVDTTAWLFSSPFGPKVVPENLWSIIGMVGNQV
eukprot:TRINITY_DN8627_c0_g2_i1.p1 TRINITY_DN8627_c0_g2~~TRINITY_DN8627_c0_g2_i1.p1  ORF type:complete len:770 (+),score=235.49 TRINITY_DN8627_c0_g2_i1:279-2588(+)